MKELFHLFGIIKMTYGAANAVAGMYKGHRAKGQVAEMYRQCYETNVHNRGIIQANEYNGELPLLKEEVFMYSPTNEEVRIALLPSKKIGTMQSAIVTGSKSAIRNRSVRTLIDGALNRDIPVIALHCDNYDLTQTLGNSTNGYRINIVERGQFSYNPFIGMSSLEIGRILFDSIPEKYQVKYAARDIISIMAEVIFARNITPSPATLASCPIFDLRELIKKMADKNIIQPMDAKRLIADYNSSQDETRMLAHYLMDLGAQLKRMSNDNGSNPCNIMSAIENREAIVINAGSNSNELAVGLVTNQLKLLLDQGNKFLLVLDDIDLTKYKPLLELALHNRTGYVLSHDDLFSSVGGDEKVFSTVTGNVGKTIIHATASGFSCEQWSKYLGEYERHEPEKNVIIGHQGMIGASASEGIKVEVKREARVPPEILNQLQGTQACIYDGTSNRIMFVNIF